MTPDAGPNDEERTQTAAPVPLPLARSSSSVGLPLARATVRMRTKPLILAGAGVAIVAAFLLHSLAGPSARPTITIGVLSYTNYGGPILSVRVGVTNVGRVTIRYNPIYFSKDAWVRTESTKGWRTNDIGPYADAPTQPLLLKPGSNTFAALLLPPGTLRWQVGYKIRAASLRERVTLNMPRAWRGYLHPVLIHFLSSREGPEREIESPLFDAPHVEPPSVDGGMPVPLSSTQPRPAATDADRSSFRHEKAS